MAQKPQIINNDSKTCQFCGGEIRFRTINGVFVPIHESGCPCITHGRSGYPNTCHQTNCPYCGQNVFFVRHNDGSVWFDALGQPWDKHICFLNQPEPAFAPETGSFKLKRILRVMRFYKLKNGKAYEQEACYEIHFGPGKSPLVRYFTGNSCPSDEIIKWKGRYCYVSDSDELVFFNGNRFSLFRRGDI